MIRRTFFGAAGVAILLLLISSRPVAAQGLSALAAAAATASMEKTPGCWACREAGGGPVCEGGHKPGFYNCIAVFGTPCQPSSAGCGASASMPLDPDGATQYVSRGSRMGVPVIVQAGDPPERRNCDGVVVARVQSPDDIQSVRARTGTLTL
jgi:hypothetical protein